ncbi:hypothetical protein FQB35_07160 [Crassaminicella thermophila]|uniref:Uncharacterized protein n=1 Tax=Crassaminicella thermophila TaxID=2599308 RepID=A0A5C0SDK7_CRATE|nr:hypothetical protein [Crassaminicella thermophila]QEK12170.1 hypothetical protein FQB35_07160 [Crassaminicella thermophila]
MIYGIYSIIILSIFLLGYAIGRRIGIKEGYKKGVYYAPLKMREDVYNDHSCPLCNNQIDNKDIMC